MTSDFKKFFAWQKAWVRVKVPLWVTAGEGSLILFFTAIASYITWWEYDGEFWVHFSFNMLLVGFMPMIYCRSWVIRLYKDAMILPDFEPTLSTVGRRFYIEFSDITKAVYTPEYILLTGFRSDVLIQARHFKGKNFDKLTKFLKKELGVELVVLPHQAACPYCKEILTIETMGIFKCPHCREFGKLDPWGEVLSSDDVPSAAPV